MQWNRCKRSFEAFPSHMKIILWLHSFRNSTLNKWPSSLTRNYSLSAKIPTSEHLPSHSHLDLVLVQPHPPSFTLVHLPRACTYSSWILDHLPLRSRSGSRTSLASLIPEGSSSTTCGLGLTWTGLSLRVRRSASDWVLMIPPLIWLLKLDDGNTEMKWVRV